MSEPRRIFDVNGGIISHPDGFFNAVQAIVQMIDGMEEGNFDRADMRAMLAVVVGEAEFHLLFLKPRNKGDS